jgi:hypothetical protein
LLLELARQLIERARKNETEPIPVVFHLASWKEKQKLDDWLAEQLNTVYYVPKNIAPAWVDENKMLLLLDGLDEVRQSGRAECVEAINHFRKEHGLTSMAVCSRSEEYAKLGWKLVFGGAIEIQPLTSDQVTKYFMGLGKEMTGIQKVLEYDAVLRELAETPLFLSIMTLAYRATNFTNILVSQNMEEQRKHLFDTYIERMFTRPERSKNEQFKKQDVLHYIPWLAHKMIRHNQVPFLLEHIQPDWLNQKKQIRDYRLMSRLFFGLLVVLLVKLIMIGGQMGGLGVGLSGGLISALIVGEARIGLMRDLCDAIFGVLVRLLAVLLVGLLAVLLVGLLFDLSRGLIVSLIFGFLGGILSGLYFRGPTLIQHYAVRFILSRNNILPWKLVSFLDHCVDLIFLRRVGGGYIFVHRLLMEHFAEMDV